MVRASCAAVADRPALLAEHFYDHLFELAPQVREMFPEDMTLQNERMSGALMKAVKGAHNPARVEAMLRHMGAAHSRHHSVAPEHYPYVGRALVRAVRDLSPEWAPALGSAWVQVYEWMAAHMVLGAEAGPESSYEEAPTVSTPEPAVYGTDERTTFDLRDPRRYGPEEQRVFGPPEPVAPGWQEVPGRAQPEPSARPEPQPWAPQAPPTRNWSTQEPQTLVLNERVIEPDRPKAAPASGPSAWWQDSAATAGKAW